MSNESNQEEQKTVVKPNRNRFSVVLSGVAIVLATVSLIVVMNENNVVYQILRDDQTRRG